MPFEAERDVVLIVDDVPENLALLCDALDDGGYDVLVATHGEAALELVGKVKPDAILLDAVMPGMGGFDTCRLIRAEPSCSLVPIIFMTALTETEHIVKAFRAGGVDYVTKPIAPDEVIVRLASHIRSSRALGEARGALDSAGQAVIVFDRRGGLVWTSSRARDYLAACVACNDTAPAIDRIAVWIVQAAAAAGEAAPPALSIRCADLALLARYEGPIGKGRLLCVLESEAVPGEASSLSMRFGLTPREVEVLTWIASGKTDRDIAEILGMRPRTVNKHLEHIYVKLGVETRTAAAALAQRGRTLGARSD